MNEKKNRRSRRYTRPHNYSTPEPIMDCPAEDEEPMHKALLNWAAWCVGRTQPGHCQSAEWRYIPKGINVFNPPEARTEVNEPSAIEVNAALLDVPEWHRAALVMRYHARLWDRTIYRHLGVHRLSYQRFMRDARLMLRAVLLRRKSGLVSAPQFERPLAALVRPDGPDGAVLRSEAENTDGVEQDEPTVTRLR